VAFAVAGSAVDDGIVVGDAGLLRSARDAVFVRDESDYGLAGTIGGDPSGGNSGNSLFYFETVLFENVGDVF